LTSADSHDPNVVDATLRAKDARVHFVGVAGSGMSALAHARALEGGAASGSDRDFDRGLRDEERATCANLKVALYPQDGSGVDGAALVVASTAVEADVPDLRRARERGVPIVHRSDWLAAIVRARPTIAIAGTSGKSTTVAMTFEGLRGAGLDPGVLTGGDLLVLKGEGLRGNAYAGREPLVIEADESDKSLTRYAPTIAVVLNLQRDHDEIEATAGAFETFLKATRGPKILGDDRELDRFRKDALTVGFGPTCDVRARDLELRDDGTRFRLDLRSRRDVRVDLPLLGRHNVENAAAALAAIDAFGADVEAAAEALARYRGVARRFEIVGRPRGAVVVDDFAHNPAKVAAALAAARLFKGRVRAFFQPHGFGPLRFMRKDLADAIVANVRTGDEVFIGDVYFAGGTATADVSSADLVADLRARGVAAERVETRATFAERLRSDLRAGDAVLLMGARDPSLAAFARAVADALA
jgi:UDP-N-acetylmuramate-alanine ligase